MTDKKKSLIIAFIVSFGCVIMSFVDGVIQPNYWVKSAIKIVLFTILPLVYSLFDREVSFKSVFTTNKKGMKLAFSLCIPVFVVILGAYFIFKDIFDFSKITTALTGNIGVNKDNFLYVGLYISFCNSFLEEFFFRGFAFLTLKETAGGKFAYIFSSLAFAFYHVAIMTGWFSFVVFVISVSGLFIGGLIFDYLDDKSDSIYPSWLVHMFSDFAIILIGFMLFGILQ